MSNAIETDHDPAILSPSRPLRPEQVLAAAVIRQALLDARGPTRYYVRREDVADARAFLAGPELDFWLLVAGFDERTREGVRRLVRLTVAGRAQRRDSLGRARAGGSYLGALARSSCSA